MENHETVSQETATATRFDSDFATDVRQGLDQNPKRLSSKYFYDPAGDRLFQQIMHMESYYLTRAELEILQNQKSSILEDIDDGDPFDLIELGAGDGLKTKILLEHFVHKSVPFNYEPCDISGHVLSILEEDLRNEIPELSVQPLQGDYFKVLESHALKQEKRSVLMFLGSNIGNYSSDGAKTFLRGMRSNMKKGDLAFIGFDLKKDPNVVLKAYNDPDGITARFNLNLLTRINRELDGDFDPAQFQHHPVYDPVSGECRSYLLSKRAQKIRIGALDRTYSFVAWEPIFMEISRKHSPHEIKALAEATGFDQRRAYMDSRKYFTDVLWEAV